jgi:hypothetical protein
VFDEDASAESTAGGDEAGKSRGDEGAVVSENGVGAVGGGRWMNVRAGATWWCVALGESKGSLIFEGGRSALRVAYVRALAGSGTRRVNFMMRGGRNGNSAYSDTNELAICPRFSRLPHSLPIRHSIDCNYGSTPSSLQHNIFIHTSGTFSSSPITIPFSLKTKDPSCLPAV